MLVILKLGISASAHFRSVKEFKTIFFKNYNNKNLYMQRY